MELTTSTMKTFKDLISEVENPKSELSIQDITLKVTGYNGLKLISPKNSVGYELTNEQLVELAELLSRVQVIDCKGIYKELKAHIDEMYSQYEVLEECGAKPNCELLDAFFEYKKIPYDKVRDLYNYIEEHLQSDYNFEMRHGDPSRVTRWMLDISIIGDYYVRSYHHGPSRMMDGRVVKAIEAIASTYNEDKGYYDIAAPFTDRIPGSGVAQDMAAEIVSTCNYIIYRYLNDGDLATGIQEANTIPFINMAGFLNHMKGSNKRKFSFMHDITTRLIHHRYGYGASDGILKEFFDNPDVKTFLEIAGAHASELHISGINNLDELKEAYFNTVDDEDYLNYVEFADEPIVDTYSVMFTMYVIAEIDPDFLMNEKVMYLRSDETLKRLIDKEQYGY